MGAPEAFVTSFLLKLVLASPSVPARPKQLVHHVVQPRLRRRPAWARRILEASEQARNATPSPGSFSFRQLFMTSLASWPSWATPYSPTQIHLPPGDAPAGLLPSTGLSRGCLWPLPLSSLLHLFRPFSSEGPAWRFLLRASSDGHHGTHILAQELRTLGCYLRRRLGHLGLVISFTGVTYTHAQRFFPGDIMISFWGPVH